MDNVTEVDPLSTERMGRLMVRYAVPSVISLVVNALYNMVDQVFIGQGVGYLGNAATNVIMPLTTATIAVGQMIGDGAAAHMSLDLGKHEKESAEKGVGNAISLIIGFGFLFLLLFELFMEPVCWLFGATDSNIGYSIDFGRIIVLGFPASAICIAFSSIIRADGRPNASMAGLLIGCVTNLILDPVFIFAFGWGCKGRGTGDDHRSDIERSIFHCMLVPV